MGTPAKPVAVKRIAGLLASSPTLLTEAREVLARSIAHLTSASAPERWSVSGYYDAEIGPEIWRQYVTFAGLMAPEDLVALKLATNDLEQGWRSAERRPVNIDPGYLDFNRLVLASTKDAGHRVYLGRGIYGEVTLRYVDGEFVALAHTYADYAMPSTREFFSRARAAYRSEVAAARQAADRCAR
jgi:hypothetical protein